MISAQNRIVGLMAATPVAVASACCGNNYGGTSSRLHPGRNPGIYFRLRRVARQEQHQCYFFAFPRPPCR